MNASRATTRIFTPLLWLFLQLTGAACGTGDVVVAELDSASNAHPCRMNAECAPTAYCAKATCSDTSGSCLLRPLMCDNTDAMAAASCGCDGVTYWNDCLREQSGVAAHTDGECAASAAMCSSADAAGCPTPGASCARLLPGGPACPADTIGACWVLPPDCPMMMPGTGTRWLACDGSNSCDDTCAAIRSGMPHRHDFVGGCR